MNLTFQLRSVLRVHCESTGVAKLDIYDLYISDRLMPALRMLPGLLVMFKVVGMEVKHCVAARPA